MSRVLVYKVDAVDFGASDVALIAKSTQCGETILNLT